MTFKDYFSGHATDYAKYRPHYPAELFTWLAQQCAGRDRVWDCATGNGQAAIALADHFQQREFDEQKVARKKLRVNLTNSMLSYEHYFIGSLAPECLADFLGG